MKFFQKIAIWIDTALAHIDPLPCKKESETTQSDQRVWSEHPFYKSESNDLVIAPESNIIFSNNIVLQEPVYTGEEANSVQMPSEWPVRAKLTSDGLVTEFRRDGVLYAYIKRTPLPKATSYDVFKANGLFVDRVEGDWPIHRIIEAITGVSNHG